MFQKLKERGSTECRGQGEWRPGKESGFYPRNSGKPQDGCPHTNVGGGMRIRNKTRHPHQDPSSQY